MTELEMRDWTPLMSKKSSTSLSNAPSSPLDLWQKCDLDQKQRLQRVFFPDGLVLENKRLGTKRTSLLFQLSQGQDLAATDLVRPR